jgi:hypothetical protein
MKSIRLPGRILEKLAASSAVLSQGARSTNLFVKGKWANIIVDGDLAQE